MTNRDSYVRHVLNLSPTKQTHSFSKAERFPRSTKLVTQAIYQLPSTSTKRSTSFGIGEKMQFSDKKTLPPPGSYRLHSDFDGKQLRNVPSIGVGRQKVTFGSFLLETLNRNKNLPSPDRYNPVLPRSAVGGGIGIRIKTQMDSKQKKMFPGPGTYKLTAVELGNGGHYPISKFKQFLNLQRNVRSPRYFNSSINDKPIISSTQRNSLQINYQQNLQKQLGKYSNSRFHNAPAPTFGKDKRKGLQDKSKLRFPGFKYRRFSQFGTQI